MLIILRLIHILFGVFWVGTAVFVAVFLIPTVRALGPGGGAVMQQLGQKQKLPVYIQLAAVLTVLSGISMYWRASGGFSNAAWLHSGTGMTFSIGAISALVAITLGIAVVAPTAKRAGELGAAMAGAGKPPTPEQQAEMQRLQMKFGKLSAVVAVLLIIATAAMAVARYVP